MRMRPQSLVGAIAAGMLIFLGSCGAVLAPDVAQGDQTQMIEQLGEDPDQASNPPDRVAQLSDAEGSVSLEPAGTSSWTDAALNRPLTLGDKLWTDQNSRAELDIGDAVIRLGSTTGFSFLNLDDQTAQMRVTAGTVIVHVRTLATGEQDEIDTPNLALTLEQPGTYRVEVSDSGDTTIVKVEDGEALATGGGQSYPVAAQQSVTFTGTSTLATDYAMLGAPDALDNWSMQREQQTQQQASVAQEYVPPDTVGADDLGSYGTWEDTPDWGYAWFPDVTGGWAPYSTGNWLWVSPWGWTWVDAEPWGFAPFHYGRWGYWNHRWCWVPGPQRRRAIYAPALVAWVGGAHVGWYPLGPRDVYVPGYHASAAYVRNINLSNTRLSTAAIGGVYEGRAGNVRYGNSGVPGAITAVPRSVFTSAQPVGPHRLPQQVGANFRANTAAPAIVPARQSVLGPGDGRFVRTPPRAIVERPVVVRLAPPRAPVAFAREQAAIRANGGRPLPVTELARMQPNTPVARVRFSSPTRSDAAPDGNMSARERALQQPSLPASHALRNDRPPWAQGRALQSQGERAAPQQQFAPGQPFNAPERQAPEQHFTAPAERQVPQQHFSPPPERQIPQQHFAPPPERQIPQQQFAAPRYSPPRQLERAPAPRAAPARPPAGRPAGRPPAEPHSRPPQRADAAPISLDAEYAQRWQSPPPMYRPQEDPIRYSSPARQTNALFAPYRPSASSPPPMYRPVPVAGAAAAPAPGEPAHFATAPARGAAGGVRSRR